MSYPDAGREKCSHLSHSSARPVGSEKRAQEPGRDNLGVLGEPHPRPSAAPKLQPPSPSPDHSPPPGPPRMEHRARVLHRREAAGPLRRGGSAQNPTGIRDRAVGTQVGRPARQPAAGKHRPRPLAIGLSAFRPRSLPRP